MALLLATACAASEHQPTTPATVATAADARSAKVSAELQSGRELLRQHRLPEAEQRLRAALAEAWGFSAPWLDYRAEALSELARCLLAQGKPADARASADEARAQLRPGALASDQRLAELETTRGEAFCDEQQLEAAATAFEAAALASARHRRELAPAQLAISLRLAETLEALGRRQDAKQALERARPAAEPALVGPTLTQRFALALAALYDTSGESARAEALLAELGVARPAAPATAPAPVTSEAATPANAAKEVVAMQADFRACYRASIETHGDIAGRVALVISIAADGHVSDVRADGSGLPLSTVDCLRRRAALARFEPPKGGSAVITVPVTFVSQAND